MAATGILGTIDAALRIQSCPRPAERHQSQGREDTRRTICQFDRTIAEPDGKDGWEYQRAELLPSEERTGLTGSATNWRNVLVFRRAVETDIDAASVAAPAAEDEAPLAQPIPGPEEVKAPAPIAEEAKDPPLSLKGSEEETDQAEKSKE